MDGSEGVSSVIAEVEPGLYELIAHQGGCVPLTGTVLENAADRKCYSAMLCRKTPDAAFKLRFVVI